MSPSKQFALKKVAQNIHIMLDLETLDTGPDACIVSIGACVIGKRSKSAYFYRVIDIEKTSPSLRGTYSAESIVWWMKKSEEARAVFSEENKVELWRAIEDFLGWIAELKLKAGKGSEVCLWGNAAAFDNVILRSAAERHGHGDKAFPVHWNDRCYRTVVNLATHIERKQLGTHHNALDDAISQSKHLIRVLRHLGKTIEDVA